MILYSETQHQPIDGGIYTLINLHNITLIPPEMIVNESDVALINYGVFTVSQNDRIHDSTEAIRAYVEGHKFYLDLIWGDSADEDLVIAQIHLKSFVGNVVIKLQSEWIDLDPREYGVDGENVWHIQLATPFDTAMMMAKQEFP